jgi:hypothetical protein
MTPAQVDDYAAQVEVYAEATDDVHEVRDLRNKWGAITEYIRRTSRQGVARAEAAERKLEVRIGVLLGPREVGGRGKPSIAPEGLSADARSEFRLMADHADVVEAVIASSSDESPPSRRKVVNAIRSHRVSEMNQEGRQALDDAGVIVIDDPVGKAEARFRTEIVAGLLGRLDDLQSYANRYDIDVIAAHVANDRVADSIIADIESAVCWLQSLYVITTTTTKKESA